MFLQFVTNVDSFTICFLAIVVIVIAATVKADLYRMQQKKRQNVFTKRAEMLDSSLILRELDKGQKKSLAGEAAEIK